MAYNHEIVAVGPDQCGSPSNVCTAYDVYNTKTKTVTQDLAIYAGSEALLDPAVTVDGSGNAWLTYTVVSPTMFASVVVATWNGTAYSPTTAIASFVAQGSQFFCENQPGCTGTGRNGWARWGDYGALVRDPTDGNHVWAAAEYGATASSNSNWSTIIAHVKR